MIGLMVDCSRGLEIMDDVAAWRERKDSEPESIHDVSCHWPSSVDRSSNHEDDVTLRNTNSSVRI